MPTPEIVWVGPLRWPMEHVPVIKAFGDLLRRNEKAMMLGGDDMGRWLPASDDAVCIDADHAIREFRGWRSFLGTANGSTGWSRTEDERADHLHDCAVDVVCLRPLPGPILAPASDLGEAWPAFVAELIGGG